MPRIYKNIYNNKIEITKTVTPTQEIKTTEDDKRKNSNGDK